MLQKCNVKIEKRTKNATLKVKIFGEKIEKIDILANMLYCIDCYYLSKQYTEFINKGRMLI